MAGRLLDFLLLAVGFSLILASAVLAFPGGPAYEQTYEYNTTVEQVPMDARDIGYLEDLGETDRERVERAMDDETIHLPAHRDFPPTVVVHRSEEVVYLFDADRHYDVGTTAGKAGILAFLIGSGATITAIRRDLRRR